MGPDPPKPHAAKVDHVDLTHVPENRRAAVQAFLEEVVGRCPYCDAEITRTTSRGIDWQQRLGCHACVTATVGTCSLCGHEITREQKPSDGSHGLVHAECADRARRR
jgi:hypothetical protein